MTTTTATPALTGIVRAHGMCNCCGRTLGRVFQLSDGGEYGRVCAAKITGYKVTDQAVRIAATLARNKVIGAELSTLSPTFAAAWATIHESDTFTASMAMDAVISVRMGQMDAAESLEWFNRVISR